MGYGFIVPTHCVYIVDWVCLIIVNLNSSIYMLGMDIYYQDYFVFDMGIVCGYFTVKWNYLKLNIERIIVAQQNALHIFSKNASLQCSCRRFMFDIIKCDWHIINAG